MGEIKAADGSATQISPIFSAPYQLALRTPGISPHSASSRKQIRHSPNWRRKARARPQRLQRFTLRTSNFGFLFFAIQDFLAKLCLLRAYSFPPACRAA